MFEATTADTVSVTAVRVSFWQSVKAGIGVSVGIALVPAIATLIQMVTKIPVLTYLLLLRFIH